LFSALPDDLPVLALPGPTGAVQEKVDYGGQPLYLWLKPFPAELTEQPLWLTVALPVAFLDANNQRALTILLISTVLITVAGLSLATWFVRRLTRPLEMLRSMAEMVAQGNLETTVPVVAGPIEVESLATALRGSQQRMRTALDEAAHTNRRLDSLVQSIAEGMLTLNSGGTITFANAGAEALIGRPLADLVGSHIDDNLWLRNGEPISKRLPAAPGRLQLTVRTAAAAQSLQVTATQLPPVPFEPAQRVLVLRDMTEEESLRRLQSQFLAGISHEFQTPLATLRAAMELLLANDDTRDSDDFERRELTMEDVRQLLGPMHLSLTGLQTLVNNLLESGRIEAGQFVVTMQPLRFEPVVTAALEIIQPQLNRKGQALVLSEPAEALVVTGDRSRLVQVLVNLLSNASKYSPSGTPIELELLRTAHWLTARIHDRGPGVAPADRAHLFRSFVRLEHHAANAPGTGLGLYVAKQIIDAHGGEVGVDNRAGGGATFWFTLPLQMGGEAQGQGLPAGAADFYEDLDL
jgi:signal transduction histidine kinase